MCVKMDAMVLTLPGGWALQAAGSRFIDKNLVQAIVDGKDLDCGWAEQSLGLVSTRRHGFLGPIILLGRPTATFLLSESKTGDIIVHRFGLERGKHLY
jgi:hypothetical protein